ncbi:MAG: helix-turn-helix transcriptional regulator [Chloroflexi bacterium]|nr:helix-turn-helix transcriptional regulator [Chloroflexota bacterium]
MNQQVSRADARANRARLIDAAHEVFRERGIDAEMKEIADRAGVGVGTVYRNFPSKDDLIVAIAREMVDHIRVAVESAMELDDPIAAIRAVLTGGFAMVEQFGDMMMMLHGNIPPACHEEFEQFHKIAPIAGVIRKGIEAGVFRPDIDADVASTHLIAAFIPWTYQGLRATRTVDQIIEAHTGLFLSGVMR